MRISQEIAHEKDNHRIQFTPHKDQPTDYLGNMQNGFSDLRFITQTPREDVCMTNNTVNGLMPISK